MRFYFSPAICEGVGKLHWDILAAMILVSSGTGLFGGCSQMLMEEVALAVLHLSSCHPDILTRRFSSHGGRWSPM